MKKIIYPVLGLILISMAAFEIATSWKIKAQQCEVKFTGGKISGEFTSLKADIQFDKANPSQSKISATVDANSLGTGFFIKTSHAKDAIDAEKYPTIHFVASEVTKTGSGYDAAGKLTLKGVTKPTTIHFTFDDKGNEGIFKGSFKVVTKDFGITRNGSPDELTISLVVPVAKS
jgi:polyisoprenoid-binding protein YceI